MDKLLFLNFTHFEPKAELFVLCKDVLPRTVLYLPGHCVHSETELCIRAVLVHSEWCRVYVGVMAVSLPPCVGLLQSIDP